jgi:hypothetical protein
MVTIALHSAATLQSSPTSFIPKMLISTSPPAYCILGKLFISLYTNLYLLTTRQGLCGTHQLASSTPYVNDIEVIEFEGITRNPDFYIGGVQINPRTNLLSIVVDYWPTFATGGQDISGTNYIMLFDPSTRKLIYNHARTIWRIPGRGM